MKNSKKPIALACLLWHIAAFNAMGNSETNLTIRNETSTIIQIKMEVKRENSMTSSAKAAYKKLKDKLESLKKTLSSLNEDNKEAEADLKETNAEVKQDEGFIKELKGKEKKAAQKAKTKLEKKQSAIKKGKAEIPKLIQESHQEIAAVKKKIKTFEINHGLESKALETTQPHASEKNQTIYIAPGEKTWINISNNESTYNKNKAPYNALLLDARFTILEVTAGKVSKNLSSQTKLLDPISCKDFEFGGNHELIIRESYGLQCHYKNNS